MAEAGAGTLNRAENRTSAALGALGAALAALETVAPGVAVGIRIIGHDDRTRRLGNAAMNAAVGRGVVFDHCGILAELANGQSYKRLSVLVKEPDTGLNLGVWLALVMTGLDVLSHLDNLGVASAAA